MHKEISDWVKLWGIWKVKLFLKVMKRGTTMNFEKRMELQTRGKEKKVIMS